VKEFFFLFAIASKLTLGSTQPPIQWDPGAYYLVVKRPVREAYQSPPFSAEIKNMWSYTSTNRCVFMAWYLVKHKENFTVCK